MIASTPILNLTYEYSARTILNSIITISLEKSTPNAIPKIKAVIPIIIVSKKSSLPILALDIPKSAYVDISFFLYLIKLLFEVIRKNKTNIIITIPNPTNIFL